MDPLKLIEKQSGFLRLIWYLDSSGEKPLTTILDDTEIPVHQLYSSIEKGKELGLISTVIDGSKYPPRSIISLTAKGKKVAEKIGEILNILKSG
jgi:DNA-binding PadR family transcriptional regulator